MSKRKPSLVGRVIGRLTVVSFSDKEPFRGVFFYNCQCECGNYVEIFADHLRKKNPTKSCGCLQRDVSKAQGIKLNMHAISHWAIDEDFD
jgi:hypothetical protein